MDPAAEAVHQGQAAVREAPAQVEARAAEAAEVVVVAAVRKYSRKFAIIA